MGVTQASSLVPVARCFLLNTQPTHARKESFSPSWQPMTKRRTANDLFSTLHIVFLSLPRLAPSFPRLPPFSSSSSSSTIDWIADRERFSRLSSKSTIRRARRIRHVFARANAPYNRRDRGFPGEKETLVKSTAFSRIPSFRLIYESTISGRRWKIALDSFHVHGSVLLASKISPLQNG